MKAGFGAGLEHDELIVVLLVECFDYAIWEQTVAANDLQEVLEEGLAEHSPDKEEWEGLGRCWGEGWEAEWDHGIAVGSAMCEEGEDWGVVAAEMEEKTG